MGLGLAVSDTLGNGSLSATTANTDTVNNVSLLSLVAQSSSLVGAGGVSCTVDGRELSKNIINELKLTNNLEFNAFFFCCLLNLV